MTEKPAVDILDPDEWWRVGRSQDRNIYRHRNGDTEGEFMGVMFSGEVAAQFCAAMNAAVAIRKKGTS